MSTDLPALKQAVLTQHESIEQLRQSEGVIPYMDFVSNLFAPPPQVDLNTYDYNMGLLHIALGIAGEYIELYNELEDHAELKANSQSPQEDHNKALERAYTKAQKELGDLCYYIHMFANFENITLPAVNPLFNSESPKAIEQLIDMVKRKIFYKLNVDLHTYIIEAWSQMNYIANSVFNLPIEFFVLQNKEKLLKRYPQGTWRQKDVVVKKDEQETPS